jgi:hypothetical protein
VTVHSLYSNDSTLRVTYTSKFFLRDSTVHLPGCFRSSVVVFRASEFKYSFYDFMKGKFVGRISTVELRKCEKGMRREPSTHIRMRLLLFGCYRKHVMVYSYYFTYDSERFVMHLTNGTKFPTRGTTPFFGHLNDIFFMILYINVLRFQLLSARYKYHFITERIIRGHFKGFTANSFIHNYKVGICLFMFFRPERIYSGVELCTPRRQLLRYHTHNMIKYFRVDIKIEATNKHDSHVMLDKRGNMHHLFSKKHVIPGQRFIRTIHFYRKIWMCKKGHGAIWNARLLVESAVCLYTEGYIQVIDQSASATISSPVKINAWSHYTVRLADL